MEPTSARSRSTRGQALRIALILWRAKAATCTSRCATLARSRESKPRRAPWSTSTSRRPPRAATRFMESRFGRNGRQFFDLFECGHDCDLRCGCGRTDPAIAPENSANYYTSVTDTLGREEVD